jgi:hypothetical protein
MSARAMSPYNPKRLMVFRLWLVAELRLVAGEDLRSSGNGLGSAFRFEE